MKKILNIRSAALYGFVFFLLLAGPVFDDAGAGSITPSQCLKSVGDIEQETAALNRQISACKQTGRCQQLRVKLNRTTQRLQSILRLCAAPKQAASSSTPAIPDAGGVSLTTARSGMVAALNSAGNPPLAASTNPGAITLAKDKTNAANPKFDKLNCKFWIFGCSSVPEVTYGEVDGELFVDGKDDSSGIDASDVNQGGIGDCYYLSSVAAIARQNPDMVKDSVRQNEDGSYSVDFYKKRQFWEFWKPEYSKVTETVDGTFPLNVDGTPAFAQSGDTASDGKLETWVMAMEKAYADFRGNYNSIASGGFPEDAMEQLTGKKSQTFSTNSISLAQIAEWDKKGYAITMSSRKTVTNKDVVASHAYYLKSVDAEKDTIFLGNPWGYNHVNLSEAEFKKNYAYVAINPIK